MQQKAAFRRLQTAYASESWESVVEHAALLQQSDLPASLAAPVALFHGRALFTLGRNRDALEQFAIGLAFPPSAEVDTTEFAYFAGMAAMMEGDLERARTFLKMAIERADEWTWAVGAAQRGLAQVATELGLFDEALETLRDQWRGGEEHPLTHLIYARASARNGDAAAAREHLSVAPSLLPDYGTSTPDSVFMTIASSWVSAAETYLELGHAPQAHAALDACAEALEAADSPDIPAAGYLQVFRAGAARLEGRLADGDALLAAVASRPPASEDLPPLILRERARVAHDRGNAGEAARLWEEAAAGFERIGYRAQASAARGEISSGPPRLVELPAEEEGPAEEEAPAASAAELPDGLILTLPVSDDDPNTSAGARLQLAHRLEDALGSAGVGEYDGWAVGDGTFAIYCYGDPKEIWRVVKSPLLESGVTEASVTMRIDGWEETMALDG